MKRQIGCFPRSCSQVVFIMAGALVVFGLGRPALAQLPGQQGNSFDPEWFFNQFFQSTDAERRELSKIAVPWNDECAFGNQAFDAFLAQLRQQGTRVLSRGREVEYLQSLVELLKPQMRHADRYRTVRVLLVESPEPDARCFPGGTLMVFRGLLGFAQTEAAIVGVLGHELSHVDHGHQLRAIKSMKLAQQKLSNMDSNWQANMQRMMSSQMMLARVFTFQPEDETIADRDGATWAYRCGYDPREFGLVFERLHKRNSGRWAPVPVFFRSHPDHLSRHRDIMKRYGELVKEEPRGDLYVGRENLVRRVPRSTKEFKE